jgi:hypothetical protein
MSLLLLIAHSCCVMCVYMQIVILTYIRAPICIALVIYIYIFFFFIYTYVYTHISYIYPVACGLKTPCLPLSLYLNTILVVHMAVNPRQVTASYTNLCPYRRHIMRLDVVSKQIEFLSDPNEYNVATSGWHGIHDWAPMCRAFMLREFRFLGQNAQFHYNIMFHLHAFSAGHNIWRYTGYMAGMAGTPIAEIIIWHTANVPSRAPPGQGPSPPRQMPTPIAQRDLDFSESGSCASLAATSTATPAGAPSVASSYTIISSNTMCTWSGHGHAVSPSHSGSTTSVPSHSDSGSQVNRCHHAHCFWV